MGNTISLINKKIEGNPSNWCPKIITNEIGLLKTECLRIRWMRWMKAWGVFLSLSLYFIWMGLIESPFKMSIHSIAGCYLRENCYLQSPSRRTILENTTDDVASVHSNIFREIMDQHPDCTPLRVLECTYIKSDCKHEMNE